MTQEVHAHEAVKGRFPTELGRSLAEALLGKGDNNDYQVCFDQPITIFARNLPARHLISAFFTSFMTALHEEAPEFCGLAIKNITWDVEHNFQRRNIETWIGMFERVVPKPLEATADKEVPQEYLSNDLLRASYPFSPHDLARYSGDEPGEIIVEVISWPAPPSEEKLQCWLDGKLTVLPQATIMVRTTPSDPTTVKEVYAFQLEVLPHEMP